MGFIRIYSAAEWDEMERQESKKLKHKTSTQSEKWEEHPLDFETSSSSKQEEENQELLDLINNKKRLVERFQLYGVHERRKINGDGNCQFAAVADQLFSNIKLHKKIRELVAEWLRVNKDYKVILESIILMEGRWNSHIRLFGNRLLPNLG